MYYSIDKFRAAYQHLIPAMTDKRQWPKSTHGFFMHPPLLKATTGRPKTERYKGCSANKRKKASTSALFVQAMAIIGTTARKVIQRTLLL